jgi:hypothetical protein
MYDDDLIPTGMAVGAGGLGAAAGPQSLAFTGSNTVTLVALALLAVAVGIFLLRSSARKPLS